MQAIKVKSRFNWLLPVKAGLLAGVIALLLALVGIVEIANQRPVIPGVLSVGQTLLLLPFLWAGYRAVRQAGSGEEAPPRFWLFVNGALAGLLTGALLTALLLVGKWINLRTVFINASPELYNLLTMGAGPAGVGILVPMIAGLVLGVVVAAISLLPERMRGSVVLGLSLIPVLAILSSALFAGRGLSIGSAIAVFVAATGGSYLWSIMQARVKERINNHPAGQRAAQWSRWALPVLIIALLPLLGKYPSEVMDMVGLYALMGLGLNIVVGFAGLLDLGYVAFFAIGAYVMGVLTSPEIGWTGIHLGFWGALPFAVITATLAGIILGIPVLGMRGDYLAIVTLGFGEIIRLVVLSDWLKPYIGGSNGITRIPKAVIGPLEFGTPQTLYYLIVAGCLIVAFASVRLKPSRLGRAWMALREDEDVAQAMGINLVRTKLLAFATGATFAGLSGAIFASKLTSIYPHSFNFMVSINVLCLIIVGGMGSIPGAIVGSLALVGLPELLREFTEYRLWVYGAALVFMMLNRPEGLVPEARRRLELHESEVESLDESGEKHVTVPG
ncbi:MAG: leucine/isoleucine/valine transporter permease subunit [Anaerolineae bacterium]|nr:leucine/isoleucine/valine transporter permease subunit [Anaerolineae bacterium]